jgi:hypothetical protein
MLRKRSIFILFVVLMTLIAAFRSLSQKPQEAKEKPKPHYDNFPIVSSLTEKLTDPVLRTERAARGKKFNSRYLPPIDDSFNGIFTTSDWAVDLPALPIEKSVAVVIGRVDRASAFLSENKTNIYSEFSVNVESVFKSQGQHALKPDSLITVQREGGRVKLSSGRIAVSAVDRQDMPQVGKRYLFFLTHYFVSAADDLQILTAYELREGRIYPLDLLSSTHPISKYAGVSETDFLTDLSNALAKSQAQSR